MADIFSEKLVLLSIALLIVGIIVLKFKDKL
jgi:hypothetical protein